MDFNTKQEFVITGLQKELTRTQDRIQELEGLVREMGTEVVELKNLINSEDIQFKVRDLPTEFKAYGVFERLEKILNRPEVKAIMEKKP